MHGVWRGWGGLWKLGLLGAAARRQGDSRCVCSDGGAGALLAAGVVERSEISEHSEHSEGLADARSWLGVGAA